MNSARMLLALLACAASCTSATRPELGTTLEGQACAQASDCLAGLGCVDKTCQKLASNLLGPRRGDACTSDAECAPDLVCGPQSACASVKGAALNEACGLTDECTPPLVCHGNSGVCVTLGAPNPGVPGAPARFGIKDLGEACAGLTDCRRPYLCAVGLAAPTCQKLPLYLGPSCTRSDEEQGAFRAYYELPPSELLVAPPAAVPADFEFYRLPFPNDVRLVAGRIVLAGHASPGEVLGIDVAGGYLKAVSEDADGFAINGSVFVRFTDMPTAASLCLEPGGTYPPVVTPGCAPGATCPGAEAFCAAGGPATVYLVNIDKRSPSYNAHVPLQLAVKPERGQYMCQNGIGVAPLDGVALAAGTTYAVVVTTGIRDLRGSAPIHDQDFARVLAGDAAPTAKDPTAPEPLSDAVRLATQPLRDWIAAQSIDAADIAVASSFTTGHPSAMGTRLRAAVAALPAPSFDAGAFECGAAPATYLCHQPAFALRDCPSVPSPLVYEVHGTYKAPAFQSGTRPYATAADGGALSLDAAGLPQKTFDETMCFALSVPRTHTPGDTYPVVIVAHGTGGNYRNFALDPTGIVKLFTDQGFAVISFDNVMHGPRQDAATTPAAWQPQKWDLVDPGRLFFNILNPRAARDNVLQGAADLFSLTRLVREAAPLSTPSTGEIRFDPAQVYFFGHSQGTVIAPAYLAEEPHLRAAIWSGAGAELALSILNKREPLNLAEATGALFADRNISRVHPMMSLIALLFGPADALGYAGTLVANSSRAARPFLLFSGLNDHFTPAATQEALIRAAALPLVKPVALALSGVAEVAAPLRANLAGVTAGVVQLSPDCGVITDALGCAKAIGCSYSGGACQGTFEGHFVVFDHPGAATSMSGFLQSAKAGAAEIVR